jgi:hypothetical protein
MTSGKQAVKAQRDNETAIRERTGRGWDEWFALLDSWGATGRSHTEIARWLVEKHRADSWWAQTITVGYEQERGMRAPGQQSDGSFSVSASKTVAVPVDRLFEAFTDAELRGRWLPEKIEIRTTIASRSLRASWEDGPSRIAVGFTAKGDSRAQVALVHEKLADADAAARMKAFWRERLNALQRLLEDEIA